MKNIKVLYNVSVKKRTSYIIILGIIIIGLVLDLVTKWIFAEYFANGAKDIIVIPNFFKFTYLENTGAAYGIFGDSTIMLAIISIVFIVVFILYDYFNHSNNIWYILGVSMIVSGAIGNFVDRIFLGYVRDFISMSIFNFVFNIADTLITFGVICFIIYLIISLVKERKEKINGVEDKK